MSSGSVWVLGTAMTKIGRYPEKDIVDLGSEVALDALADAAMTIRDVQVMAVGNAYESTMCNAQRIQKQIGQTGIPAYNVTNACATGATAVRTVILSIRAGEADVGLAIGVEQMGKMGLLGTSAKPKPEQNVFTPSGRYGSVIKPEGILGTSLMPGIFATAGRSTRSSMASPASSSPRSRSRTTDIGAQPARPVPQGLLAGRDPGRGGDLLPQHAADVLSDR